MKNLFKILILSTIFSVMFASCTDSITSDDETVLEIQATDKEDSVNPNNNGEDPDSNEEG